MVIGLIDRVIGAYEDGEAGKTISSLATSAIK